VNKEESFAMRCFTLGYKAYDYDELLKYKNKKIIRNTEQLKKMSLEEIVSAGDLDLRGSPETKKPT